MKWHEAIEDSRKNGTAYKCDKDSRWWGWTGWGMCSTVSPHTQLSLANWVIDADWQPVEEWVECSQDEAFSANDNGKKVQLLKRGDLHEEWTNVYITKDAPYWSSKGEPIILTRGMRWRYRK